MAEASATLTSTNEVFTEVAEFKKPAHSLWGLAWKRFLKHKAAVAGGIGFILIIAFIVVGSFVYTEDYANQPNIVNRLKAPSWIANPSDWSHPMGTDSTGRDIFARIIYGGQISLAVGFLAVLVALILGVLIGALSGYYGGIVDAGFMRFTEAMLAIPSLLILIVLSKAMLGRIPNISFMERSISGSVPIVILVLGLTSWMVGARIVRAQFLSIREHEYILAARSLGVKNGSIIWKHILPNTMAPIIVFATLGLVVAITSEAYVSFLGLGVQEPTASWGNIMNQALSFIQRGVWWLWFFPSLMIILTLLCVNFLGDGLRDALDPRNLVDS